jgi:hypothetical protein
MSSHGQLDTLAIAVRAAVARRTGLDEEGACLVEAGSTVNATGDVSGFAPPGDIHRVRNVGNRTAISIHIYGTDVARLGSSVRHDYDLPVLRARAAA